MLKDEKNQRNQDDVGAARADEVMVFDMGSGLKKAPPTLSNKKSGGSTIEKEK